MIQSIIHLSDICLGFRLTFLFNRVLPSLMTLDQAARSAQGLANIALKQTFRSLRHKNFRLFFSGQIISLVGTWVHNTALSWLVYSLTFDPLTLGTVSFIGAVPVLLLSVVAGTVADEYPKRRILILAQAISAFLAFVLAILLWTDNVSLIAVYAINFFFGIANAFEMPTRQSFVVEMVGREDLSNAVALNSAVFNGARLIGPALGAAIMASATIAFCFLFNGVSFLAVILSLALMRFEKQPVLRASSRRFLAMKEGVGFLMAVPQFRALMILVVAMTLFGWSYTVNLPVVADRILGGGAETYAALLSANGIGALFAALTQAAFAHRLDPRRMVFTGITVFFLALAAIPFSQDHWLTYSLMVVTGWGIITFFITANTYLQHRVTDEMRGRVMGIYTLSFAGLFPFGSLFAGYLASQLNVEWAFWINAVLLAVTTGLVWWYTTHLPRLAPIPEEN